MYIGTVLNITTTVEYRTLFSTLSNERQGPLDWVLK